jgi:hypothetical protein
VRVMLLMQAVSMCVIYQQHVVIHSTVLLLRPLLIHR